MRESPWDEVSRNRALALLDAEGMLCPKCGRPRDVCGDPEQPWHGNVTVCYATQAQLAFDWMRDQRLLRERGGMEEKRTRDKPTLAGDGEDVWVSEVEVDSDADYF